MKALFILSFSLLFYGCGKETPRKSSEVRQSVSAIYASRELQVKVYYEEGAEPYTDKLLLQNLSLWNILETNIQALFEGKNTVINVPKSLSEMNKLSPKGKTTWSLEDVLRLSTENPVAEVAGVTQFQVFFLKGYADGNPQVIGFHISNTKIIAIFKDVIKSSGSGQLQIVPKYVEQATLVHEMGHALGLVNNGLPMTTPHQDASHGAHCNNPDCVMYYTNEGATDMLKFARGASEKNDPVMFDPRCLSDARNYQN